MIYKATSERHLFLYLLGIDVLLFGLGYLILTTLVALFCIVALFASYEFEIEDHTLQYRIKLFHFLMYEKQVNPQDVKAIHFKRTNWTTRLAIVKLHKGFNIRIMLFKPLEIFHQLSLYGERNNIEIRKTEDYKIMEKRLSNS